MNDMKKHLLLFLLLHLFVNGVTAQDGARDRQIWVDILTRTARPVLENLSNQTLRQNMPMEFRYQGDSARLSEVMLLEVFGRTMYGIAPWLELGPDETAEGKVRAEFIDMAVKALTNGLNPKSPDYLNFRKHHQPLVDAAMLVQGLLRAPNQIWNRLDKVTQNRLITELKECVKIQPYYNNWLLFPAVIEAFILQKTGKCNLEPIKLAIKEHQAWYKGDSWYGDGKDFHYDYYNSLMIHPLLYDILTILRQHNLDEEIAGKGFLEEETKRYVRYATQLERMISPEGTFPIIGRSMVYRSGALNALGQVALLEKLPHDKITPEQVRCALTKVYTRLFTQSETYGTYEEIMNKKAENKKQQSEWWLRFGFCGYQPEIAEGYISTASLYFSLTAFAPLGLSSDNRFWTGPYAEWTNLKGWSGKKIKKDQSLTHN